MYELVEKRKENRSRVTDRLVVQKQNIKHSGFVYNRLANTLREKVFQLVGYDSGSVTSRTYQTIPEVYVGMSTVQRKVKQNNNGKWFSTLDDEKELFDKKEDAKEKEEKLKKLKFMVTKRGMEEVLKEERTEKFDTFTGRWTSQISHQGPRDMSGELDPQLLRHLSTAFFFYFRNKLSQTEEQEVECMLVNERLIVSSNFDSTMKKFKEFLDSYTGPKYELLSNILATSHEKGDVRAETVAEKFTGEIQGTRDRTGSSGHLVLRQALLADLMNKIDCIVFSSAPDMVTNSAFKNKVIMITGIEELHAEQKLVLMLVKSGYKGLVIIRGKKRPCTSCYLMLRFAKEVLSFNIDYNIRPGGYWVNANSGLPMLWKIIKTSPIIIGTWLEKVKNDPEFKKTHRSVRLTRGSRRKSHLFATKIVPHNREGDSTYDSASDSEYEAPPDSKKRKVTTPNGFVMLNSDGHPVSVSYPDMCEFNVANVNGDGNCFYICCLRLLGKGENEADIKALRTRLATEMYKDNPTEAENVKTLRHYASEDHIAKMSRLLNVTFIIHYSPYTGNTCFPIRVGNKGAENHLLYRLDPAGYGHIQPMYPHVN